MGRALLAVLLLVAQGAGHAEAAPLSKEECDGLKAKQTALAADGVRAEMARGASWAKVNLTAERMARIAQLIEVDEQILFRCGSPTTAANDGAGDDGVKPAVPADTPKPAPRAAKAKEQKSGEPKPAAEAAAADAKSEAGSEAGTRPKKPSRSEPAAEKKKRAAAQSKDQSQDKPQDEPAAKPPAKRPAKAQAKADDAYVPPEGAPQSLLKPPLLDAAAKSPPAKPE